MGKTANLIIENSTTRVKGCPKSTFIGLCISGELKGINKTDESNSPNYKYAKCAIDILRKDENLSKVEVWSRVQEKMKTAVSHQGQLDVLLGLWDFIR